MALTNLASLDNVKSRIIAEKGISCFHYLQVRQFDDGDDGDCDGIEGYCDDTVGADGDDDNDDGADDDDDDDNGDDDDDYVYDDYVVTIIIACVPKMFSL